MRSARIHFAAAAFTVQALALVGCSQVAEDTATADADLTRVGPNHPERKAVMNALRDKVKVDLANQDVGFDVSQGEFNLSGNWVWMRGRIALRATGGEPRVEGTIYADEAAEGLFDGWHVEALLKKMGGGWTVVQHGIGTKDVWWSGIASRYPDAPAEIFTGAAAASNVTCNWNGRTLNVGDSVPADDGCNACLCQSGGYVSCTEIYCIPAQTCSWSGRTLNEGDSVLADDGCNSCWCHSGAVSCTEMYCR